MFSRLKSRTDPRRLGTAYSRWDFALGLAQRLVEISFLLCLMNFLAEDIWSLGEGLAGGAAGQAAAAFLMVAAFGLARVPAGLARSSL
ncbi:MAG: hypothetical protein LBQ79_06620, partial [Deltaproteobacteria bacterium]|nr:hypothetical protein [Deltaproteobacteria bacterium]